MTIYIPYTYLIGWSEHNIWYYGVRYAKQCNPSDLWNPYKTSSKYVKQFIIEHGDPDIIQIRKTFKTSKQAREWETKVLKRMNVLKTDKWLNKNIAGAIDSETAINSKRRNGTIGGWKQPLEANIKRSNTQKGRMFGPMKESIKEKLRNCKRSEETKEKLRGPRLNSRKPKSKEHKQKLREAVKRIPKISIETRQKMCKPKSEETKLKISFTKKTSITTVEGIQKIRETKRINGTLGKATNIKSYVFLYNEKEILITNLAEYCRNNDLIYNSMLDVNKKRQKTHRDYGLLQI